ncbi:hypothetical protein A4G20_01285 [Pasteurellaceae bacterium RH1A]|nr:hypothetical protein A4G20_01285 [Pasteurellaceae bacterium RH1A]
MSEKLYHFTVTSINTHTNSRAYFKYVARNVTEAKNRFKADWGSNHKLVACVKEDSVDDRRKKGAKDFDKAVGGFLGNVLVAAGVAGLAVLAAKTADKKKDKS